MLRNFWSNFLKSYIAISNNLASSPQGWQCVLSPCIDHMLFSLVLTFRWHLFIEFFYRPAVWRLLWCVALLSWRYQRISFLVNRWLASGLFMECNPHSFVVMCYPVLLIFCLSPWRHNWTNIFRQINRTWINRCVICMYLMGTFWSITELLVSWCCFK